MRPTSHGVVTLTTRNPRTAAPSAARRTAAASPLSELRQPPAGWLRREPVQGADDGGDERVSATVAGIVEDVKLTGAPPLRQLPRGVQRAADVLAALDEDAVNAVQGLGIPEQLVLREEGGVPPVVRDQAREPEAIVRIVVAQIREMAGGKGDVRIFPGAPLPRGVIADGGI